MKRSIASASSRLIPRAANNASRIFARTALALSGAGSEPRLPQKRTSIAVAPRDPAQSQAARSSPSILRSLTRRLSQSGDRFGSCRKYLHDEPEMADRENLIDDRGQRGDRQTAARRFRLPGSDHQRAQAGARDVFDMRKVDQHICGRRPNAADQSGLEHRARIVVDAPRGVQHDNVTLAILADFHTFPWREQEARV